MAKTKSILLALVTSLIAMSSSFIVTLANENQKEETYINLPSFYNTQEYFRSNKYTNYHPNSNNDNNVSLDSNDRLICKVSNGTYYLNEEDLSFKFVTNDGYIHSSKVTRKDMDGNNRPLNTYNYGISRSALYISYYDVENSNLTPQYESFYSLDEYEDTVYSVELETEIKEDGFSSKIHFTKSGIKLTLNVKFSDEGVKVNIPYESIEETNSKYSLASICVYHFLGAVQKDLKSVRSEDKKEDKVTGYHFVPDGVGALIRYGDVDDNQNPSDYRKRIYGDDEALPRVTTAPAMSQISMPVFGYVHGERSNGMVCIIESGDMYCDIVAKHAQRNLRFYQVYPEFIYRETYNQPTNSTGGSISLVQKEANVFDINLTYKFLEDDKASYVGMANEYKDYLLANNMLNSKDDNDSSIPLRVETIGNELTNGVLFKKRIIMTKFKEFNEILDDVTKTTSNITPVMNGYAKDGVTWASPRYDKLSKKLGNIDDLTYLDKTYFYNDYVRASSNQSGYNERKDVSKKINTQIISKDENAAVKYYLTPSFTKENLIKDIKKLNKKGIKNFALDSISSIAYSNYGSNKTLRDETIETYKETLASLDNIALYSPNAYALKYTDKNFDYSMYNNQYMIFDDCVPFSSIVQSGHIDLYSTHINFFGNVRDDLLRMVDYNVYPSFLLTNNSSSLLEDSSLNYIYSSRYEDLKEAVKTYYDFVNEPLKEVMGASIVNREVLLDGVIKVSYSNSKTIYVNYTNSEVNIDGVNIAKKGYAVI